MDAHALAVLEFDKLRALLAGGAASALGLEAVDRLQPVCDQALIARWQRETSEVRALLDRGFDLPLGGLHDVRPILTQVGIGGVAEPRELLAVAETLRCIERLAAFCAEREDLVCLGETARQLLPHPAVADEIERCLTDDGEVADDASAELRRLRQQVRNVSNRLQSTLRRILSDIASSDAVQDPVVTLRDGRYCVPIKASHQGQFQGLIHDRSASGATVFMEPAEVVKLNNELREAQFAEKEEVQRILAELSHRVAAVKDDLSRNLAHLTVLDLARARGKLSLRLAAVEPTVTTDGNFDLRQARHPLLVDRLGWPQVVAADLRLDDTVDTVLITGPNTGGKTVSLKTVGLLTLMAQAGLHVPADQGTRLPICAQVFADIGDEQSLEQSLSTFGAHLRQIVHILREARPGALVLLDEVGAGTDPTEGAALAEAVLTWLHRRGCRTVATTHHGSLKHFAYLTEGVENASVEFDARTLAPTYRLLTGIPGASHAFEIAERYGLPGEVVSLARDLLPEEHHDASAVIMKLQASRRQLDREVETAEHEAAIASHERRELEKERRRLRELEREVREDARREAARLLEQVQREAEGILGELRRADREGRGTEQARRRLAALRAEVKEQPSSVVPRRAPVAPPGQTDSEYAVGDQVEVLRLACQAEVLAVADDGQLTVQAGRMRMELAPAEVALVRRGTPSVATTAARRGGVGLSHVDLELHLRGETVDDALVMLDRYLDQALLSNLPEVRIVHGKGTGTLKRAVQEYLRQHPYVKSYQHPPEALGGGGVTVARLDA